MKKNILKLVSAAIVAVLMMVLLSSFNPCRNVLDFRFFPDPLNCACYFECDNGIPVRVSCPPGLYFCAQKESCTWMWDPMCTFNCAMIGDCEPWGGIGGGGTGGGGLAPPPSYEPGVPIPVRTWHFDVYVWQDAGSESPTPNMFAPARVVGSGFAIDLSAEPGRCSFHNRTTSRPERFTCWT